MKRQVFLILLSVLFASPVILSQEKRIPVEPYEERANAQHRPKELMDIIGLKEGMVIADIGAGRGRMTVWFADRVGAKGKVYANDIDRSSLDYLENRCRKNNITNVKTILGKVDDPLLPAGEVDIAFMVSVYHHLEKPVELLKNTIPSLKNDGVLVIVERDPVKTGQISSESTSREDLIGKAAEAGYQFIKFDTALLERDNIYFFRVKR
jgi:ubiquinone/menaquinone biosynthesis C-methylase UbiE